MSHIIKPPIIYKIQSKMLLKSLKKLETVWVWTHAQSITTTYFTYMLSCQPLLSQLFSPVF